MEISTKEDLMDIMQNHFDTLEDFVAWIELDELEQVIKDHFGESHNIGERK